MSEGIITFIGLAAAALTTFAFLPQSVKAIRTKHTKDLSLIMLLMQFTGLITWLAYGLLSNSLPVILANTISVLIMAVLIVMKLKYG